MLNLIYRNRTQPFVTWFNQYAESYDASKLNFNTREEYLDWVKQWKEDMKIVTITHSWERYTYKQGVCQLEEKIKKYQIKLDKLPVLTPEQINRYNVRMQQFLADYDLKPWFSSSFYLVWYMLILRKAAKMKAAKQREKRLQTVAA